ncbi:hypothetical protein T02_8301 [Trichinella nativa]|uniref:Uncharacterized protein n=1 Tax=Trichinella nativa TaxID=6335 RepID=A0A0V1KN11_9BILA|nr:hypothetical protein T02_8301 [Trichinella nativa]
MDRFTIFILKELCAIAFISLDVYARGMMSSVLNNRNMENHIPQLHQLYAQTQVAIVLLSPSCIGLAAPCNFRPEVALSHTRLGITETIASLSSNNKIFKLYIIAVTATTLPVGGLMVTIALLTTGRVRTRS